MNNQEPTTPRIIVDDDWKSQAQAEKERLAEAEAAQAASKAGLSPKPGSTHGVTGEGPGAPSGGELPPADFPSLVGMLATQALMYLGGMADKKSGGVVFDPEMGRFYIDLLSVVEAKTKGNLTDEEARDIAGALHELRSRFVEMSRAVAAQIMRERAGGGPLPGPGSAVSPPLRAT